MRLWKKRFQAICGASYKAQIEASKIQENFDDYKIHAPANLWDDPLLGIHCKDKLIAGSDFWDKAIERYEGILENIKDCRDDSQAGSIDHAYLLTDTITKKMKFRRELMAAYESRDREKLASIRDNCVPQVMDSIKILCASMRKQWMRRNKPFGFETIQNRLNALVGRYEEVAVRIDELLNDVIDSIQELDEKPNSEVYAGGTNYRKLASGSCIT